MWFASLPRLFDCVPVVVDCVVVDLLLAGVRWLLHFIYSIDWYCRFCSLQVGPRSFDCIPVVVGCVVAAPLLQAFGSCCVSCVALIGAVDALVCEFTPFVRSHPCCCRLRGGGPVDEGRSVVVAYHIWY